MRAQNKCWSCLCLFVVHSEIVKLEGFLSHRVSGKVTIFYFINRYEKLFPDDQIKASIANLLSVSFSIKYPEYQAWEVYLWEN